MRKLIRRERERRSPRGALRLTRCQPGPVKSVLRKAERVIRELWGKQYSQDELKSNPDRAFKDIIVKINEIITHKRVREILVLTPFMYEKYAKKFARFVRKLKEELSNIDVVVVTRASNYVNNRQEHMNAIKVLENAGITVCVVKNIRFHAKAVVLGAKYVIAGSVNPLAPSYGEFTFTYRLIKLLENELSATTIIRIFKNAWCTA